MRYDTPVYFQRIAPGVYDEETGNYGEETVTETMKLASVVGTRTDTMRLIYGEVRQGSLTIHLQMRYDEPFDRVRIGDKVYAVDHTPLLRTKQAFILSEVV